MSHIEKYNNTNEGMYFCLSKGLLILYMYYILWAYVHYIVVFIIIGLHVVHIEKVSVILVLNYTRIVLYKNRQ